MPKAQKYFAIFQLSFVNGFKNYKALIGLSIFLMTCMIIFAHLWKVAAAKIGAIDLDPDKLLWYIAFNEWVITSIPDAQDDMEQDLRSGRLAYLLPRPISYLGATFAEAAGTLTVNLLVLGVVTFLFTWFQTGALPFDTTGLLVSIIFGFMAGLLAIIFQMVLGGISHPATISLIFLSMLSGCLVLPQLISLPIASPSGLDLFKLYQKNIAMPSFFLHSIRQIFTRVSSKL